MVRQRETRREERRREEARRRNEIYVPRAEGDDFEIAEDLGIRDNVDAAGWGGVTNRETGRAGGNWVREMAERAEEEIEIGDELYPRRYRPRRRR